MTSLSSLPRDVLGQVLRRCDCISMVLMSRSSRTMHTATKDQELWENLFSELGLRWRPEGWNRLNDGDSAPSNHSWRQAFDAVASSSSFVKRLHDSAVIASPHGCPLQHLVDSIEEFGIIQLLPGTYRQSIFVTGKKRILLIGTSRMSSAIRPHSGAAVEVRDEAHVALSNLTVVGDLSAAEEFQAPGQSKDAVLRVCNGVLDVDHCDIVSKIDGIDVEDGFCECRNSDVLAKGTCFRGKGSIKRCLFEIMSSRVPVKDGTAVVQGMKRTELRHSLLQGGGSESCVGVRVVPRASCLIHACAITAVKTGVVVKKAGECHVTCSRIGQCHDAAVQVHGQAEVRVEECEVWENGVGIMVERWLKPELRGCRLYDRGARGGAAKVVVEGCEMRDNTRGQVETVSSEQVVRRWSIGHRTCGRP